MSITILDSLSFIRNFTVPKYIENVLIHHYYPIDPYKRIKLMKWVEKEWNSGDIFNDTNFSDLKPYNPYHDVDKLTKELEKDPTYKCTFPDSNEYTIDFRSIAQASSVYFRQSLEFFETSQTMSEDTAPLVEYYGLLQLVKGLFLLEFDVPDNDRIFTYHGLASNGDSYKIKNGVFFAYLILISDNLFERNYFLEFQQPDKIKSLSEVIDLINNNPGSIHNLGVHDLLGYSYIISWILSSLVRYKPHLWTKILSGVEDLKILSIRFYRDTILPRVIYFLMDKYLVSKFPPNKLFD